MGTKAILEALIALPESPWGDLKGKPLNDTGLARRLNAYGVKSKQVRIGGWTGKGYDRADLHDPWTRYLSLSPQESEPGETGETSAPCAHCGTAGADASATDGGETVRLHQGCFDAWLGGTA